MGISPSGALNAGGVAKYSDFGPIQFQFNLMCKICCQNAAGQ